MLAYFDAAGKPGANGGQLLELLAGFVLLVVGLVLAGPWFTAAGARLMAKRANRPSTLIAGRRLLDNPKTAFRFISGLVIALFVTSATFGALSSISAAGSAGGGNAGTDTLADPFCAFSTTNCSRSAIVPSVPGKVLTELRTTPGVRNVSLVHQLPPGQPTTWGGAVGVVSCHQLAGTPAIGRCARGTKVANIGYFMNRSSEPTHTLSPRSGPRHTSPWRKLAVSPSTLWSSPRTDHSARLNELGRSLERAFPFRGVPVAVDSVDPGTARLLTMIQDMTDVVIVASLIIAACSLAVSIAAGLGERKRPFSLLRLTGVPTSVLHRVIALESALPLLIVAGVSIVVGMVSAALYLSSQVGIAFRVPGIAFWATVLGGLAASLGIIASTFPLLNRITGPEVARNE